MKAELLENKHLKESFAIVPVLENGIYLKETEIERALILIKRLKAETERIKKELEEVHQKMEGERRNSREMMTVMEDETVRSKRMDSDRLNAKPASDDDESSGSRKFRRLMEVSVNSNLISNLKEGQELKAYAKNGAIIERPNYSECNSEELAESALFNPISDRFTIPESPKRQQFLSSITSKLLHHGQQFR